jgi:molybdopterin-containing oxidoreductase family iron-sulfur binding subunit
MKNLKDFRHGYWRSLEHRAMSHDEEADSWRENVEPPAGTDVAISSLSRRRFVGVSASGAAIAGVTATSGCIRKPQENILPFSERPEDMIPGKPIYYTSVYTLGASVAGVLVESQDGRPTKIEGNPRHSGSQGATSAFAQASILDVYDPDRTRSPMRGDEAIGWDVAEAEIGALLEAKAKTAGRGLALVVDYVASPTMRAQIEAFRGRFPEAKVFIDDAMAPHNATVAAETVGGEGARVVRSLGNAHVVAAFDSDFLASEVDAVRVAREFAKTRRVTRTPDLATHGGKVGGDYMSRLYVVEPHLTSTGMMADHRVRSKGSAVGEALLALAKELDTRGVPWAADTAGVAKALPAGAVDEATAKLMAVLASDLLDEANKGRSAILVGERQPAWVHAVGLLIDAALGNLAVGQNVTGSARWMLDAHATKAESIAGLAAASADTIVCMGTNPAYDAGLSSVLSGATTIHFGLYRDETGLAAKYHIPLSHWVEAWGDARALDGTVSIQQPLIAPLFNTSSSLEWMSMLATGRLVDGYSLVKFHHKASAGESFSDRQWRRWLHDGIATSQPREPLPPRLEGWGEIANLIASGRQVVDGMEVDFHLCPKLGDGRFANNAWMQELPHPMTKLTWDNAAYVSKATAEKIGVASGDLVNIEAGGGTLQIPVFIAPGQADDTLSVGLGYGREWGSVATGAGFNANAIRPVGVWYSAANVSVAGGTYELASTQDYGTMKPPALIFDFPERPIVIENDVAGWSEDPTFVEKVNLMTKDRLHHLWEPPKLAGKQQWAMSIDLNTCTGCNACVVACQAENNIPVVGKKQVLNGREMHWMRIDRYFRGDENEPTAVVQPMLCQHCESAPCETVCPVAATVHSPEGLNEMAYNRCIGTRYCSNNCPYKVRRYNFFHYNLNLRPGWLDDDEDGSRLRQLQKNPDVTVRFRGVMEKCTYCVQRINEAKIEAHVAGQDKVADGAIITACQQVCPTGAIVFGDKEDPDSAVSRAKANSRDYQVLRDLNNGPRTTYLARIRNPHPDLESSVASWSNEAAGEGEAGHGA